MKLTYLYLAVAIVAEVIATSFLKSSDGFTKWVPSLITVVGYAVAFGFLSLTLRVMPIGVAYAIWAGAGVVLIATVGWLWHGQALDAPALIGLGLIVSGVVVVNLFSKTVSH
jgi:small multidrug resistance pump